MSKCIWLVGMLLVLVGCGMPWSRAFYVENAMLSNPNIYEEKIAESGKEVKYREYFYPVTAHRIAPGNGVVIAYRLWSPGAIFTIDDEWYEKITIFLPDGLIEQGKIILGGTTSTKALIIQGGSSWPRQGCFGYARNGYILINKTLLGHTEIEFSFDPIWNEPDKCNHISTHLKMTIVKKDINNLNRWEGNASGEMHNETYP